MEIRIKIVQTRKQLFLPKWELERYGCNRPLHYRAPFTRGRNDLSRFIVPRVDEKLFKSDFKILLYAGLTLVLYGSISKLELSSMLKRYSHIVQLHFSA